MKKNILAGVIAALISTSAFADTASLNPDVPGMGLIANEWVKAGINGTSGTFGSGGNTSPGLLFDPAGTGTFNPSYDYLTPGSPFDGFSVKVDGTNYKNNNQLGGNQIAGNGSGLTLGTNSLSWTGGVSGVFDITNIYSLAPNSPYVDITSSITMRVGATSLSFAKYIDPDSQGMPGDSSATDNVLGYGVIPSTNVAFSEATVSRYALGIYTTDTNVTAGINGWLTDADAYNGTNYYKPLLDADGNIQWQSPECTNISWGCPFEIELDENGNPVRATYGTGDDTIGISWSWANVSIGDILTASYAYIFGPSAFDAASSAITGGAGGGADTSSWGTLTDVGSATDAAESGASGGGTTPDPVITTDTIVDTSRPVLTASITHHTASDDGAVQTVARERTTSVTTPMRTVTYTDGVETGSVVADSDIVTTVTDPGSFVGRIDQMATADHMLSMANRGLSFEGVNAVGHGNKMDNGMSGSVAGVTFGGSRELDNGWSIGAGAGKLSTGVTNNGKANVDTTLINVHGGRKIEQGTVNFSLTHAMNDYTGSRTIGDFANSSKTSGTDSWANLSFTGNGDRVRPVLGITRGVRSVDGYTESGSIQSARTVADTTDWYTFGTVGAEATIVPGVTATALHHTDGVNSLGIALDRTIANDTKLVGGVTRRISDKGEANSFSIGLVKRF